MIATTVFCPRCGEENRTDATNCVACRINLEFARENPGEIERIKLEDLKRKGLGRGAFGNDPGGITASKEESILLPGLLLFGSFVFAFCLGETVHELGHFLVHRAYGVDVGIRLDPFGGSMILNGSSAPREIWGVTSFGGPLLNLLAGITVWLTLWRKRRPGLLPLLLWGPISLIQEGVTLSIGMLTPGGDAALMVEWGIPATVLIGLGVLFLALGLSMICWLLPLVNLSSKDSFGRKISVLMMGMVSFMVLRLVFSSLISSTQIAENVVPLIFSGLFATMVAILFGPLHPILNRISRTELETIARHPAMISTALGTGMVLFQLLAFN